jgi:hypothetical protein
MELSSFLSQDIEITSVYFRSKSNHHDLEAYPRRMVFQGREYQFLNDALRYKIGRQGQNVSIFDVSDGSTQFRLKQDQSNQWTLLGLQAA